VRGSGLELNEKVNSTFQTLKAFEQEEKTLRSQKSPNRNRYLQRIFFDFVDGVLEIRLSVLHGGNTVESVKTGIQGNKQSGCEPTSSQLEW